MRNLQLLGIVGIMVLLLAGCLKSRSEEPQHPIEELEIDGRVGVASSKNLLVAGQLYSVVVYGVVQYAPGDATWLDAQHVYLPREDRWSPGPVLLIADQEIAANQSDLQNHAYLFYVTAPGLLGQQQSLRFRIKDLGDNQLANNSGHLNVQIYQGYRMTLPDNLPHLGSTNGALQFSVQAQYGWQSTNILLKNGQKLHVLSVTGSISDGQISLQGGAGNGFVCSQHMAAGCCEPQPDVSRSALIGRIGEQGVPFLIGNGGEWLADREGVLQLRINDCDAGLDNNNGFLTVEFQIS